MPRQTQITAARATVLFVGGGKIPGLSKREYNRVHPSSRKPCYPARSMAYPLGYGFVARIKAAGLDVVKPGYEGAKHGKPGAAKESAMLPRLVGAAVHRFREKEDFCALVAVERPEVGGVNAALPPRLAVVLVHGLSLSVQPAALGA